MTILCMSCTGSVSQPVAEPILEEPIVTIQPVYDNSPEETPDYDDLENLLERIKVLEEQLKDILEEVDLLWEEHEQHNHKKKSKKEK